MFRSANKAAASGNKAKMFSWSVAPALMVIAAVIAHGVALNIIWPKIQGAFASTLCKTRSHWGINSQWPPTMFSLAMVAVK